MIILLKPILKISCEDLLLHVDKDEHRSEATSMPEKIGEVPDEDLREAFLDKPMSVSETNSYHAPPERSLSDFRQFVNIGLLAESRIVARRRSKAKKTINASPYSDSDNSSLPRDWGIPSFECSIFGTLVEIFL
jgi:hypothetical protein